MSGKLFPVLPDLATDAVAVRVNSGISLDEPCDVFVFRPIRGRPRTNAALLFRYNGEHFVRRIADYDGARYVFKTAFAGRNKVDSSEIQILGEVCYRATIG